MDELIAQLTQRVGLTPEQARQAAETVLGFVKTRLPAPLASHLDQFLGGTPPGTPGTPGGQGGQGGGLDDVAKSLGGMFGR